MDRKAVNLDKHPRQSSTASCRISAAAPVHRDARCHQAARQRHAPAEHRVGRLSSWPANPTLSLAQERGHSQKRLAPRHDRRGS